MSKPSFYFYLDPFVYVSIKEKSVFLYNTLNAKSIESTERSVIKLVDEMQRGTGLFVIDLNDEDIKRNRSLSVFIRDVRKYFMGDLIEKQDQAHKPVQFVPYLGLKKRKIQNSEAPIFDLGSEVMNFLKEVTLYINDQCEQDCFVCCNAYKQFLCCHKENNPSTELELKYIEQVIDETNSCSLSRLNIIGGNILKYSKFNSLVKLLRQAKSKKVLHLNYLNIDNYENLPELFTPETFILHILVPFPINMEKLKACFRFFSKSNLNHKISFIIKSAKEYNRVRSVCYKLERNEFSFLPYFNQKNKLFFKRFVYISKEKILDSKPVISRIFSRKVINHFFFGRMTILCNGNIYSSLNRNRLGNIKGDSLHEAVYKELASINSWLFTRVNVRPCTDCHYNLLCPSISNYEFAIKNYNLCNVW